MGETTCQSQAAGVAAGVLITSLFPEKSPRCTQQDLTNQKGELALSPMPITVSFTEHNHVTIIHEVGTIVTASGRVRIQPNLALRFQSLAPSLLYAKPLQRVKI